MGHNPVENMLEKPSNMSRNQPEWMEVSEASLLLHAARTFSWKRDDLGTSCAFELLATLLLTGARWREVTGLHIIDVDLERKTIVIWKNADRRLKNRGSCRVVRLWPQLEEILRAYLEGPNRPTGRLLFPVTGPDGERQVGDLRKYFDSLAARIGWTRGAIRSKMFRHTYCAARLQTLDNGQPVSLFTVSRELGHGSEAMANEVYGHLGQHRHRSPDVEYRIEQWRDVLHERIVEVELRNASEGILSRKLSGPKNRIDCECEDRVLQIASNQPLWGQDRIATLLTADGSRVSASSVRAILVRHGLETQQKRLAAADAAARAIEVAA